MDFESFLNSNAEKINQQLNQVLTEFLKDAEKTSTTLSPLVKELVNSCQGGKRIRGVLVNLGYEIARGQANKEIFKIGAAFEILHTALLIHDDIIDESPTRRDIPSLYKTVGTNQAITLADSAFFLSLKIISESKFLDKNKNAGITEFSKIMVETAMGQMLDVAGADSELIAKLKTARYSIAGPLKLGAILAGADSALIKTLDQFGENLGIAYQIRDDILDDQALSNAQDRVIEYTSLARNLIFQITKDPQITNLLEQMAKFLVERKA